MRGELMRIKLILSTISFLAANSWLIYKGVMKGAAPFFVSAAVEETIVFILLQLLVVLIFFIPRFPFASLKSKIVYWSISEAYVLCTFIFWGFVIVGPIWFA